MTAKPKFPALPDLEKITSFHKANFEALVNANKLFVKGIEEFSKELVSLTQASLESAATAGKAAMAAKTIKDAIELNAGYTKSSFETFVSNTTKLGELGKKVVTDAIEPVKARAAAAGEILKSAA